MTPPRTVHVGPYHYKIRANTGITAADRVADCNGTTAVIRYSPDQHPLMVRSAILHEILHACCNLAGVTYDEAQEAFVGHLEGALFGVLRDNPRLVAYLTSDDT